MSGVGEDWEFATEVGGVAGRIGTFLSRGTSGVAVVWSGDVGANGDNNVEVRGSSCGFPEIRNKVKGKAAEGRVVVEGGGKKSTSGSGYTTAPDLLGQETVNSGRVGEPTAYF